MVADLISNHGWRWPQDWIDKCQVFNIIPLPNLDANSIDIVRWRDLKGIMSEFSVWKLVRHLATMEIMQPVLHDIITYLQPMAHKRTTKSIFGKLILAASSYYVWLERNNRLFKKSKRSPEELRDVIMVTVRLKLLSFHFKNSANVNSLLAHWKMPSLFRLYGS
ncbi:hypothetical protein Tco_0822046 [Tanacetum coccineum]|uniref:Reverse transcriptase zinc-binding domain-containing protein n=1 Tax=Tanacetum coccineum TaxID=301880 RepID=A0ABQ5AGZ0_9ASTR